MNSLKISDLVIGHSDASEPILYAMYDTLIYAKRLDKTNPAIIVQGSGRIVILTSQGLFVTFQNYFVKA